MATYILFLSLFATVLTMALTNPTLDKPMDCPENQEYYSCYLYRCQRTCEQFKEKAPCLPLAPGCNLPGCECFDGYYKNSEGTCVPERECYGRLTRSLYMLASSSTNVAMASLKLFICLLAVVLTIASAAPPERKPLDCPTNEEYYECELAGCNTICEHLRNPPPCPSIAAGCYQPACLCKQDYLRNSEGKCIPQIECWAEFRKHDQHP